MIRCFSFFLVLILFQGLLKGKDSYPRNTSADVLHYEFSLTLNDSTDRIEGRSRITIGLLSQQDSLKFDLAGKDENGKGMIVTNVTISGKTVHWSHENDKLVISTENNADDTIEVTIVYSGIPSDGLIISKNKYGKRVFFADHWPDRAHRYLPCVDHVYDKAAVDFIITAPSKYRVVANGVYAGEWSPSENVRCTYWKEEVPLPVKVMAFGAADFAVNDTAKLDGIPVSSWVFPENKQEGFYDYSVAVKPLEFYIRNIGDYPYMKLANVQSKTIYGGLENAGTIFYSERSVTGQGRAEALIAHEIAHQWFGNSVTENDWHHVWLSEGFATYLTSMYFEETRGKEYFRTDLDSTRARVIRYYRKNRMPVIDTTVTDLMKLLNTNTYQKGAWVLHMLRNETGDDAFRKGLRLFYERFRNNNVLSDDFKDIMEEVSGKQLDTFFRQWLQTPGHPELRISVKGRNLVIKQLQDNLFVVPLEIKLITSSGEKTVTIPLKDKITKYRLEDRIMSYHTDPEVKLLFSTR